MRKNAASLLFALVGVACAAPPEGLARSEGNGPEVVFELQRKPLPEIPFPNDIATRPDDGSPTGLRINASLVAATQLERTARTKIDELSGFGVYMPIQIRFDSPIDIGVIYERHRDFRTSADGSDYDFSNDAVYLVDVTADSPTYLQPVPLDFGEGNFPQLLRTPSQYWEHDPKTITKALAFETYNEDWDFDGRLDPGEDLDLDGVLDRPNLDPREDGNPDELDPSRDLVTFYEFATNTLLFKPVMPLRERTRYAVIVTKRLGDTDGEPVRSPFPFVNHTDQTDDIVPALQYLADHGLDASDIAFAWSFTTGEATSDLVNLRNGMYGEGPLAWLAEDNPPALTELSPLIVDAENVYTLPAEKIATVVPFVASAAFGFGNVDVLVDQHSYYAYHVSGKIRAPQLIGLNPDARNLDEQAWPHDLTDPSVREKVVYHELRFWCAVPRREFYADPSQPAPVVLYAHGYTSNIIEQLGLALHAKFGITGCSINAFAHGVDAGENTELLKQIFVGNGMAPAADALLDGRIEDIDGDGVLDPGGEFFTGYMFKTRDNLRQTLLDWLTLVRFIRRFGEEAMIDVNGDGVPEALGDFNADGLVDFGGPNNVFFASGTSLGGLVSSMLSAVEPRVVAAAPISGGAGLIDLTMRSEQGGVVEAVGLRLLGPAVIGEPAANGGTRLYQLFVNGNKIERRDIAVRQEIEPGNVVMVTNVKTGEARCALVMPDQPPPGYESYAGWSDASNCAANDQGNCRTCEAGTEGTYACDLARTFRIGIAADSGDPLKIEVFEGSYAVRVEGDERDCIVEGDPVVRTSVTNFEFPVDYRLQHWEPGAELVALEDGFGFQRATPLLRRFVGIAQMAIEGADPAVYAPHYSLEPLTFVENGESFQKAPTNVLNVTTIGDPNVPVNTGIAIAKVAGFVELFEPDPRYGTTVNRVLIEEGVQAGIPWLETRGAEWGPVLVDVDNISNSANIVPMDVAGSADGLVAPRLDPPLRIVVPTFGTETTGGLSGLALPMLDEFDGQHGFPPPGLTDSDFDVGQYMEHQIGLYFRSLGREVRHDPCMQLPANCSGIPPIPE